MLLQNIKLYIFSGVVLFLFFATYTTEKFLGIYTYNFAYWFFYGIILLFLLVYRKSYSYSSLIFVVLIVSTISIIVQNYFSITFTPNFFVFSEGDAYTYDYYGRIFANTNQYYERIYSKWNYDDWGAITLVGILYMIEDSNLMLNAFYVVLNIFSAVYLMKIAENFMDKKYACICAISFTLSSYFLWFNASGLKESAMIFLIIISYYFFYRNQKKHSIYSILICVFALFLLIFFRPAISIFMAISFVLGIVMKQKMSPFKIITFIVIVLLGISFSSFFLEQQSKFMNFQSSEELIAIKESEGMIKGSPMFTFFVNLISSVIGHFPTIIPDSKTYLSFFVSGLFFKLILFFSFVYGIVYIFSDKKITLVPILVFPIMEMISLVIILEALEVRKSLPHFPMVYIIAFYGLYKLKDVDKTKLNKIKFWNSLYIFTILLLTIYWNFR